MPIFRTTQNIFVDSGEHFDPNWMNSDKVIFPPKREWDYQKEMQIEDVDIWEVVLEGGGGSVYASWSPFAEFYLLRHETGIETFYGVEASQRCYLKANSLGIPLTLKKIWVDDDSMWLYDSPRGS